MSFNVTVFVDVSRLVIINYSVSTASADPEPVGAIPIISPTFQSSIGSITFIVVSPTLAWAANLVYVVEGDTP